MVIAIMALWGWAGNGGAAPAIRFPGIPGLGEVHGMDVAAQAGDLHLLLVGRFAQTDGMAVAYLASRDGGKVWSSPVFLNRKDEAQPMSRRGNDARLAVRGQRIMAVWQARGELPGAGPMRVAVSSDGGKTWDEGANPAPGDTLQNQSYMAVAADGVGRLHLAWLDDREENGNAQGLRYARSDDDGRHWSRETTVDAEVCTCCWNRMAELPDRSMALLYRDSDPHDMNLARLPAGDTAWRHIGPVGIAGWHFSGCPHCGGGLASTGSGGKTVLHGVTWTGKEDAPGLYYSRSGDLGRRWSSPYFIGDGHSRESDIAARSPGEVAIVFTRSTNAGTPLYWLRSRDGGRHWSKPQALTGPEVKADHPRIVAMPTGFRVFWTETRPGGGKTWAMAAPSL